MVQKRKKTSLQHQLQPISNTNASQRERGRKLHPAYREVVDTLTLEVFTAPLQVQHMAYTEAVKPQATYLRYRQALWK